MEDNVILPQTLRIENRTRARWGLLLTAALFLLLFLPWLSAERELFRQEGFFAAIAAECVESDRTLTDGITATAHHAMMDDAFPLYPLVVSLFYRCGVPMETALRLVGVLMLGVLSLLAALAAGTRSNFRAGLVAGCCCFGTLFAFEKGPVGGPETLAACFLFSAQLLFFHYGSRLADWNSAWIAAAILLSLGFLSAGPVVILFFALPLVFLRRPLSSSSKFRTAGFAAAALLIGVVILSWALPLEFALRSYAAESGFQAVAWSGYLKDLVTFPLLLPVRMAPWVALMWMPFCVALQGISPLPVYSLYLRTLTFSMLALAWLLPKAAAVQIFFVVGPLAVLTGLYYDLGIRRYGPRLRRFIGLGIVMFPLAMVYILALCWLPKPALAWFGTLEKMRFRDRPEYWLTAVAAAAVLALLAMLYYIGTKKYPVWVELLIFSLGVGIIGGTALAPYHRQERRWREFGAEIRESLPPGARRIFKYEVKGLYNGLFYARRPIYTLRQGAPLPDDARGETVYVISPRYPDFPGRSWRNVRSWPNMSLSLWEGVPAQVEGKEVRP